eukprot:CAMPEP_0113710104 /NCGR_PEP_ID=MMETSP0038_2-20120614/29959_1 /TAXON_ID=2898 /ORGANISM="Cryptomonas paramecium" /LENGTH=101 /DNA_ID=CAMNT_0000636099 /DNA_START=30 /DNA_END=331 /DNA_ORIENTATION=+ /assembly_acc=CAM_ASM_000170
MGNTLGEGRCDICMPTAPSSQPDTGVNSIDKLPSQLHRAAMCGNTRGVAKCLRDHPAAIDSRDHLGRTPLHLAASQGALETVELLISARAHCAAMAQDGRT